MALPTAFTKLKQAAASFAAGASQLLSFDLKADSSLLRFVDARSASALQFQNPGWRVLWTTTLPEQEVFLKGVPLLGLLFLHPFTTNTRPPATTLLDGSAQPCADVKESTSGVPGVHAYAFNARKVPAIRRSLFILDSLDWENGDPDKMHAASREYDRLLTQVRRTRPMGYAMSNGNGDFEITVPQTDSVLVFGEAKMPGEPLYYSAKVVGSTGQDEVRVILLMCNQQLL